jgi:hypothetical protein
MKRWSLILAGALVLAPVAPAAAQSVGAYPAAERGRHSIVVGTAGNGSIGYWTRRSDRTDLGLDLAANVLTSGGNYSLSIGLTPP